MPDAGADGPLAGIRVLEVANWLAAPAGCALLADAGADVIKVETPGGEPYRAYRGGTGAELPFNPYFELDNRGKRGITVNLENPAARGVIYRLTRHAALGTQAYGVMAILRTPSALLRKRS